MEYFTFTSNKSVWRLYRGIGTNGDLLTEQTDALPLLNFYPEKNPIIWVWGHRKRDQKTVIQRLRIPDLSIDPIPWIGHRLGALACAPDGKQAVAIELPEQTNEQPRLLRWCCGSWSIVETQIIPDISSQLAWIEGAQIIFESNTRQLTLLNLDSLRTEVGPAGRYPVTASDIREWYAINNGKVLKFPFEKPFRDNPTLLGCFRFGHTITLRLTRNGQVCTWTEPRFLYQSKGYFQKLGQKRKRFCEIDTGIGSVLGPYVIP